MMFKNSTNEINKTDKERETNRASKTHITRKTGNSNRSGKISKITAKLSLYFALALLIFAIIIGSVFVLLFRSYTLDSYKVELENRATNIAQTIPLYMDKTSSGMRGFGMYLRMTGDIAGTDVWIVDRDLNLITSGKHGGQMARDYGYKDLPPNAEDLIKEGFAGETVFSEDFSDLLSELTLTVGVPIFNDTGDVIGVVLVHSPVKGINEAISQGIVILVISIILALIVAVVLSLVLSLSFTRPLAAMKQTAGRLAEGEYTAKTNIQQNDEIGQLANTLDILALRLDTASHESENLEIMRREFMANISHELRTPITVIRGSLEALIDKVVTDPSKVEEYNLQMLKESKYLESLVGDLMDLSKLQSADFVIEKTELLICDIIDDVARSASHLAEKKGVIIELKNKTENCKFLGDYGRLRQMIMLILDNAIKFSPDNETVSIILENGKLAIKDKGRGISDEDLPNIFERFYKARWEQNKTGTGLGLAIAKQIAERHDIELTAQSIQDEGATFVFTWDGDNTPQKDQA